jgi:hypothetical protein
MTAIGGAGGNSNKESQINYTEENRIGADDDVPIKG